MHLPRNAWSKNGQNTIESRAGHAVVLGRTDGLSAIDQAQLNQLYKCPANIYPSKDISCMLMFFLLKSCL